MSTTKGIPQIGGLNDEKIQFSTSLITIIGEIREIWTNESTHVEKGDAYNEVALFGDAAQVKDTWRDGEVVDCSRIILIR